MRNYKKGIGLFVKLKSEKINNFYRPSSEIKQESLDYVEALEILTKKFAPILLKEWFFILKPGGYLLLSFHEQSGLTEVFIEKLLFWLWKGNYTTVESYKKNNKCWITIQKRHTIFAQDDSIKKWSFGIVTNGERDDWIEKIINSIRIQKIPQYEIIICGKSKNRNDKDIKYIPFNERSEKGWITKKKNLICEQAIYENLCIMHDRLVLADDWYKGMMKYGNAFELLGCKQIENATGEHAGDWLTLGGPAGTEYKISRLEYDDWDFYIYLSGQLTIIKKKVWKDILWDESRYWNDAEDSDISFRARDRGYLIRFNPYSTCYALTWRHGKLPLKYDIKQGILPKDMYIRRSIRILGRISNKIPYANEILVKCYAFLAKTSILKRLIYN